VPVLLVWALVEQRDMRGRDPVDAHRLPRLLRRALIFEGAVMLAAGALLLVAPGAADDVWPWALSPLTSRAIGSFLVGIGLAALIAAREDDPLAFRGAALAYAVLGLLELLALNLHTADLGDRPLATSLYAAFWVAVVLTGGYGLSAARASSRS
jgi:peptidoglycan/LPS O-acetylase OafA/YrhL